MVEERGSSDRMTFCKDWFKSFEELPELLKGTVGYIDAIKAYSEGMTRLAITIRQQQMCIKP